MKKIFIPVKDLREIDHTRIIELISDYEKISVISTTQFTKQRAELVKLLSKKHEVTDDGTILGCKANISKTDCVVIIATGEFHAIKAGLNSNKPVFIVNPEGVNQLSNELINDFHRKKSIRISKVLDSRVIGVLVSTKPGQNNETIINEIRKKLPDKEIYLFVANELTPNQLNDFPVDAWINTACPRIIEDSFDKPIINWDELI